MTATTTSVTREQAPDRFEIRVDGVVAGFSQFMDVGSQRIMFHTEIDKQFGGQGLATKVVQEALEQTRADGLRVVPVCPFVKKHLRKNPGFEDITDRVTQEAIDLVMKRRS